MKVRTAALLVLGVLVALPAVAYGDSYPNGTYWSADAQANLPVVSVTVNGHAVPYNGGAPAVVIDNTVMVPAWAVLGPLGVGVSYDQQKMALALNSPAAKRVPGAWMAIGVRTGSSADTYAMEFPCIIGAWTGNCSFDTGTSGGASVSPAVATAAGIVPDTSFNVQTVNGSLTEQSGQATIQVGNSPDVSEQVFISPGQTNSEPLVGFQFMVDACHGEVTFDDSSALALLFCIPHK